MQKLLRVPIWNRKILIVTPPTNALLYTRKYKLGRELITQVRNDPPDIATLACVYFDDKYGRYVLWFNSRKVPTDTIIHETNHIVKHMMKYLGAQQEKEAHAYTQEYLYKEIRKALR